MTTTTRAVRLHLHHVHGFASYAKLIDAQTKTLVATTPDRRYKNVWSVYRDASLLAAERGWTLLPEYES